MHDGLVEGDRICVSNLTCNRGTDGKLQLFTTKTSNVRVLTLGKSDRSLEKVIKSVNIDLISTTVENVFEEEYSCFGLLNKVLSKGSDVCNFFIITPQQQIVSIEVVDRGFIQVQDFPKEGNYIYLDNLQFCGCIHVDHRDLTIMAHDIPTTVNQENLRHSFGYIQTKFSNRSLFKLATQNTNEETRTLK